MSILRQIELCKIDDLRVLLVDYLVVSSGSLAEYVSTGTTVIGAHSISTCKFGDDIWNQGDRERGGFEGDQLDTDSNVCSQYL